jgi:hypothetical protein
MWAIAPTTSVCKHSGISVKADRAIDYNSGMTDEYCLPHQGRDLVYYIGIKSRYIVFKRQPTKYINFGKLSIRQLTLKSNLI